ncbi:MAG: EAL domain-containing protein [Acidimicrobiales bacterium]
MSVPSETEPPRRRWLVPVRARLLAAFVVLSLLPLSALGFVAYQTQRDALTEDTSTRVASSADGLQDQLDVYVTEDLTRVTDISGDGVLQAAVTAYGEDPSATNLSAMRLRALSLVRWPVLSVSVLDEDLDLIVTTEASSARLVDMGALESVARNQRIGHLIPGRSGGLSSLAHAPVFVEGQALATVVVETDMTPMAEMAEEFRGLGESTEVLLAVRDGRGNAQLVVDAPVSGDLAFESVVPAGDSENLLSRSVGGEDTQFTDIEDSRGVPVFAATRRIDTAGWGLVVKVDSSEALAGADRFRDIVIGALIVAALTVFALSWIAARTITRPIVELTDTATAVSSGDLSTRAAVKRNDELGTLATAFNSMTDALVDIAGHEAERTSELQVSNRRLRESESRIRAILDHAADGIMHVDSDARILEFNAAAEKMFGYHADSLMGTPADRLLEWYEPTDEQAETPIILGAEQDDTGTVTAVASRKDGSKFPALVSVSRIDDGPTWTYTVIVRDISERIAFERRLEFQATHDTLTGLPNRDVMARELQRSLDDTIAGGRPVGLLFLDVDRFKTVNDTLGHQAGDELLRGVAQRLRECVRPSDVVARFGGDEFVVLARGLRDADDMMIVANRIGDSMVRPFVLEGEETFTSVSMGVVVSDDGRISAEDMLGNADVAMYRAKQGGRDRVEVFDEEMRERIRSRHEIENALRRALDTDELFCQFQPILSLANDQVVGVEALARWDRPEHGLVSPADFIPVAEESGLILGLGRQVLRTACEQMAAWEQAHPESPLRMSVNLSGRELADPDCVDTVTGILESTGANPELLILEITETVLLEDLDHACATLRDLRDLGVRIAIDDFGTGYSSLTYLRRFPADVVKIDRSFMGELESDEGIDSSIVAMVLALGRSLDLEVVAEGVENEDQLARLRELDCELVQGFLFARPGSAGAVEALAWPESLPPPIPIDEAWSEESSFSRNQ